ncbi:MAG: trypsin-like peptidase domain-containing protein [Lachnospiraceae bacterium]|jgi:serine protease Do|nr:trypsin-like peptidase domain-containing protein [Lachnospiraceae bacterium]
MLNQDEFYEDKRENGDAVSQDTPDAHFAGGAAHDETAAAFDAMKSQDTGVSNVGPASFGTPQPHVGAQPYDAPKAYGEAGQVYGGPGQPSGGSVPYVPGQTYIGGQPQSGKANYGPGQPYGPGHAYNMGQPYGPGQTGPMAGQNGPNAGQAPTGAGSNAPGAGPVVYGTGPIAPGQPAPHYGQAAAQPGASRQVVTAVEKKEKKRGFGTVVLAALAFGVIAGSVMVGIQAVSSRIVAQGLTVPDATVAAVAETLPPTTIAVPEIKQAAETAPTVIATGVTYDIPSMVKDVMPSVVAIDSTVMYQDNSWFGRGQAYEVPASGSGIIVGQNDTELLIATNNHVVEDAQELKVSFIDNTSVEAKVKGTDSGIDLAVIAVSLADIPQETKDAIKVAKMGDSNLLQVGETVVAIGNALGYGQSVTVGCISAVNREIETETETITNLLQTDAAINPGNSGGALLNLKGEVIGINAAKYSSTSVEGMGYAIPISEAKDILDLLMNKKTRENVEVSKQGYLGIQGKDITEAYAQELGMPRGVYVFTIVEDGPASKSDLREKDIITKFDGQSVRGMSDLQNMLTYYEGGTEVTLTIERQEGGEYVEMDITVTLGTRPQEMNQ